MTKTQYLRGMGPAEVSGVGVPGRVVTGSTVGLSLDQGLETVPIVKGKNSTFCPVHLRCPTCPSCGAK